MDGSKKMALLMIRKPKKPRCFSKVKSFHMGYTSNKKAWMTTKIFKDWLLNLDLKIKKQKSQIFMFLDNCSVDNDVPLMSNVKVLFLPPNMTSALQPLDQGIIQNLKTHSALKSLTIY